MKDKITVGSLRNFINTDLKDEDVIERKKYKGSILLNPEEERTAIVQISTTDADREGDVVMPNGCDTMNYSKNAVCLVDHDWRTTSIVGKTLELAKTQHGMLVKVQFAETALANDIWSLIKGGFLKATSIGFHVKEMLYKGTKEFSKYVEDNHMSVSDACERIISKSELMEFSFCAIPCNPNALIQAISAKSLNISDEVMKRLDLDKVIVIKEEIKENEFKDLDLSGEELDVVLKPFPNYHAARQRSPEDFETGSFKYLKDRGGTGIDFIVGKLKGQDSLTLQSIRFDASKFSVEQAKKWLEDYNYKTDIEPATEKPKEVKQEVIDPKVEPKVETIKEEVKPPAPPPLKIEYIEVLREGDVNSSEEAKSLLEKRRLKQKGKLV